MIRTTMAVNIVNIPPTLSGMAVYQHTVRAQFEVKKKKGDKPRCLITFTENQAIPHNVYVGKRVRPPVCAYNTFFYLCIHVFLAGGLVCERWEGVMKTVCVYTHLIFFLKCCFASNTYIGFDGKLRQAL